jgi:hypothetical protein
MAGEQDKDLMSAVGDSFGIKDAPQQTEGGDEGGDSDGQQDQPLSQPQLDDQGQADTQQPQDQRAETGSDRAQPKRDEAGQLFTDKPKKGPRGELLDAKGNIVASTRREKQLAYNLNRAQYAANQASREARKMHEALNQYREIDVVMKQNNLNHQMVREALELRALAEKDPITAVRDVIARVLAAGATMEQILGHDAVPAINASVIKQELDRRLGPMEKETQARQRQAQIEERAQEQMEAFVQQHPHAETHGVEISNLVSQHGLTPERAYFELRSWVERRGMDFTSPLKPQLEAYARRGNGGRRQSTPGDMRGVPSGNMPTHSTANGSRGDFRSNTPWRDIASAVFTELNSK